MSEHQIHGSRRLSSLLLAILLLSVLGILAYRVDASTQGTSVTALKDPLTRAQSGMDSHKEPDPETSDRPVPSARRERAVEAPVSDEEMALEQTEMPRTTRDVRGAELDRELSTQRGARDDSITLRRTQKEQDHVERQALLSHQAQARLGQYVDRIAIRMHAALDRLTQIAGRVETRISALEYAGADLTTAREELRGAHIAIATAREDIVAFGEIAAYVLGAEDPRKLRAELRTGIMVAKEGVRSVHEALTRTVMLLKTDPGVVSREDRGEVIVETAEETVE